MRLPFSLDRDIAGTQNDISRYLFKNDISRTAALSSPSLCPSPPSSPLRVLPDCSTLYALMMGRAAHLSDLPRGPLPLLWVKYSNTLNGVRQVYDFE